MGQWQQLSSSISGCENRGGWHYCPLWCSGCGEWLAFLPTLFLFLFWKKKSRGWGEGIAFSQLHDLIMTYKSSLHLFPSFPHACKVDSIWFLSMAIKSVGKALLGSVSAFRNHTFKQRKPRSPEGGGFHGIHRHWFPSFGEIPAWHLCPGCGYGASAASSDSMLT